MTSIKNTNITTLVEIRDSLRVCEAFAQISPSARNDTWVWVCGVQVRVCDLRDASRAFTVLQNEIERRSVSGIPMFVRQGSRLWKLGLDRWLILCETQENSRAQDALETSGASELESLPATVSESARANGTVPHSTHRKDFFYADVTDWRPEDFAIWARDWHQHYGPSSPSQAEISRQSVCPSNPRKGSEQPALASLDAADCG